MSLQCFGPLQARCRCSLLSLLLGTSLAQLSALAVAPRSPTRIFAPRQSPGLTAQDLRAAFDTMDVDGSGRISAVEIRRAVRRLGVPIR